MIKVYKVHLLIILMCCLGIKINAQGYHLLTLEEVNFDESTGTILDWANPNTDSARPDVIKIPGHFIVDGKEIPVKAIGERAFEYSVYEAETYIRGLILPTSLERIGKEAFYKQLFTELVLPEGLIEIGERAFGRYNAETPVLRKVSLSSTVSRIDKFAFYGQDVNEINFNILKGPVEIGEAAFMFNELSGSLVLPECIKSIGNAAFARNNITSISLPSECVLGEGAFNSNPIVAITKWPDGITEIPAHLFEANHMDVINVPGTVVKIGARALSRTNSQSPNPMAITLPPSLKYIGDFAFGNFWNLNEITLPQELEYIGVKAFENSKLSTVSIPGKVTFIGKAAFNHYILKNITLPQFQTNKGNVWKQTEYDFDTGAVLSVIDIEGGVEIRYNFMHEFETQVRQITYDLGAKKGIAQSNPDNVADYISNMNKDIVLYAPVLEGTQFLGWYLNEDFSGEPITTLNTSLYNTHLTLYAKWPTYTLQYKDVVFDDATGTITQYINPNEKDIVIPNSFINNEGQEVAIKNIGSWAFSNNELIRVQINAGIETIGDGAFNNNKLAEISLPASIVNLGVLAFVNNKIETVHLGNENVRIGYGAFNNNRVTTVNGQASDGIFYKRADGGIDYSTIVSYGGTQKNLNFLPETVNVIGMGAFDYCSFNEVIIPDQVVVVGYNAFGNAYTASGEALSSIVLPAYSKNNSAVWRNRFNTQKFDGGSVVKTKYEAYASVVRNINYELNGGTNNVNNPGNYIITEGVVFAEPSKSNDTFAGWYTDSNFSGEAITSIDKVLLSGRLDVTLASIKHVTLYAKWDKATAIETVEGALSIYPNPASVWVKIEAAADEVITFYSLTGRLVKQVQPGVTTIPVNDLPKGIYLVKAGNEVNRLVVR